MKKTFTILTAALMLLAMFANPMRVWADEVTLTSAQIKAGSGSSSYGSCSATDGGGNTWNAYAIKNQHSNATSAYNFWQIKKYASNTAYYIQVPELGTKITTITMTVSNSSKPMDGGGNSATLYFSASNSTSATGTGVASGTGESSVTIDCSSLNLNTGYITASGAVRIWDVSVTYTAGGTPSPSMSVSPASIDFGSENTINPENPYTETFDVTFANLTESLSVSVGSGLTGVSVSPTSITANATSPQTITVSYNPTTAGSISGNISVNSSEVDEQLVAVSGSAYDPENVDTYERYTGALVEGDYIICANEEVAMKNVISGSRFENEAVTVTDNKITNPGASIIWHVAPEGDYFTMYNAAVGKYAAGTNSNNQGTLIGDITDYAKWNITYQYSNYTVICYGRNSSSNKYLRRNGDYGWATYANSTGQVPTFYKKVVANQVAMPTFSPAGGTYYAAQNVTLSCTTSGATIYYTTDGSTPTTSSTVFSDAIPVSSTTTINAIAVAAGMTNSEVATATYTIELPLSTMDQIFARATEVGGTATPVRIAFNNWVVSGANTSSHAFITDGTKGFMLYASGHGFTAGNILSGTVECNVQLYNGVAEVTGLTSTTSGLTVTTGGTVSVANITMANLAAINTGALVHYENLTCEERTEGSYTNYYLSDGNNEIQAYKTLLDNYSNYLEDGKTYNITGVFVQNNSTKRILPRSTADIEEVVVPHDEYTLTVSNLSHVDLFVFDAADPTTTIISGTGSAQVYDGTEIMISVDVEEGYVIESLIVDDVDVTNQIDAADTYTFTMPTHAVTITASAEVLTGDQYELYSGALVEGDYIIYYNGYAMKNARVAANTVRLGYETVTPDVNDIITTDNANIVWHIAPSATNGYWTIYNENVEQYAVSNGEKNKADMSATLDDKALWSVTVSEAGNTYEFANKANVAANVNNLLRNNGTNGFACYSNQTGGTLSLYKKVGTDMTFELSINGYGENTAVTNGWYLVASPVAEDINPAWYNGFITSGYDLYRFNPTATKQWENHKVHNFDIEHGRGYLYASQSNTKLLFTGTPHTDSEVTLAYTGWNLIGNPSNIEGAISQSFYVMNDEHNDLVAAASGRTVHGLEGIFVYGNAEDVIEFTEQPAKRANSQVTLNIVGNNSNVIDRAIVNLNEDGTLPKFMIDETNTKIYIPQNDGDYAIVSSNGEGSMPVNFKAKEMGMYTISVETEGIDLSYLHLIDRLTGEDIDLLIDSKYSFIAASFDMESRFILSFGPSTGATTNDNFAFQNGNDIIVNGEGELQVFDVTGRMVKNTVINGVETIAMPQGVYIFRLNENIQKIVVR